MVKNRLIKFLLNIFLIIFQSCAIKPLAWEPNKKPPLINELEENNKLQSSKKINLDGWYGPEDIVFDSKGNMYCGVHIGKEDFSDGRILKVLRNGDVEIFYNSNSWVSGLHFDKNDNLIALSHKDGLIKISPEMNVEVLANKDELNHSFLIPNGLDISSDGTIYFSNSSHESRYNIKYGKKLILEMKPNGGLYKYNPKTKKVTTLINETYFGNGVTLSKNEDFILMTETTKYRIIKYWIKGEKKGKKEIFMDNLPGFPNGISLRKDGTYWVGFTTKRNDALDKIHSKPIIKKLIFSMPKFLQPKQELYGMILNVNNDGKIISALYDTSGVIVPETGAVKEYDGYLYIGGDVIPYIANYKIQ